VTTARGTVPGPCYKTFRWTGFEKTVGTRLVWEGGSKKGGKKRREGKGSEEKTREADEKTTTAKAAALIIAANKRTRTRYPSSHPFVSSSLHSLLCITLKLQRCT
jgi:hypothetical protein